MARPAIGVAVLAQQVPDAAVAASAAILPPAPAPAPAGKPTRVISQADKTTGIMFLIAIVGIVVGSFLPWVTADIAFYGHVSKSGTSGGDGWIFIVGSIAFAVTAYRLMSTDTTRPGMVLPLIAAIALGALAIFEFSDASNKLKDVNNSGVASGQVGIGLFIIAAALVLALVATIRINRGQPATP